MEKNENVKKMKKKCRREISKKKKEIKEKKEKQQKRRLLKGIKTITVIIFRYPHAQIAHYYGHKSYLCVSIPAPISAGRYAYSRRFLERAEVLRRSRWSAYDGVMGR